MKTGLGLAICVTAGVLAACVTGQAQAGPAAGAGAGEGGTILATGGSSDNKTDVLWVLTKIKPVRGPERTVLVMYKVDEQGKGFSLRGARMIDADARCVDLQPGGRVFSVKDVLNALPPEEKAALQPPPAAPERP